MLVLVLLLLSLPALRCVASSSRTEWSHAHGLCNWLLLLLLLLSFCCCYYCCCCYCHFVVVVIVVGAVVVGGLCNSLLICNCVMVVV